MKYVTFILTSVMLGIATFSQAQEMRSAYFEIADYKPGIQRIELEISDVLFVIDRQGNILSARSLNRSLPAVTGDLEFDIDGSPNRNKGTKIDYYNDFDENKAGKIKSVNGIPVDYYSRFDIHDLPGKIKSIGKISFRYNNAFDIHDEPGTFKSLGNINIKYYNAFDINDDKGNLKSIGSVKIGWYNSMDLDSAKGRVKYIRGNTEAIFVDKQRR